MVWHTHMLNPRLYLEDTMRKGRGDIWASGLPWDLIDRCLSSNDFTYDVWESSKSRWKTITGLAWDNTDDGLDVEIVCPACTFPMQVPWSTCDERQPDSSIAEDGDGDRGESSKQPPKRPNLRDWSLEARLNLIGHGLADGKPLLDCPACHVEVDHDLLCFHKFAMDAKASGAYPRATMPGTLLDPRTGMPELNQSISSIHKDNAALTAPNRLARMIMVGRIGSAMQTYHGDRTKPRPTMESLRVAIRSELEKTWTLAQLAGEDGSTRRDSMLNERLQGELDGQGYYENKAAATVNLLFRKPRVAIQRMLAQYNDNWSSFALDLRAAVLRQGVFVDNMYRFDWLHGADPSNMMIRTVNKYARFLQLAKENPSKMVVPTLDVDLAWHTHQLSPKAYYHITTHHLGKFLDHDDKVDENKLSVSFDWMSEAYYKKYKEMYSECLCWYCQGERPYAPLFGPFSLVHPLRIPFRMRVLICLLHSNSCRDTPTTSVLVSGFLSDKKVGERKSSQQGICAQQVSVLANMINSDQGPS